MTGVIKAASEGITLVSEIMKAAGDNPNVKEAGSNLGQTALTITKTINNVLLPLAAVNFAFDKARRYFDEKFADDIGQKVSAVPLEDIVEPKATIAGPALQGLAFTHEVPSLRDMYLSLLATAMDRRVSGNAHPAFVEIIKQIDFDEPEMLAAILTVDIIIPIVQVRVKALSNEGWRTVTNHLTNPRQADNAPSLVPNFEMMFDNWIRLGLIEVNYASALAAPNAYSWVETRPEYIELKAKYENDTQTLSYAKGVFSKTALGAQFAKAVGMASKST